MTKNIMEIFNTPFSELNKFELFIYGSVMTLLGSIFFIFISALISPEGKFLIVFLSLESYLLFCWILIIFNSTLEKHFNMYYKNDRTSNSFEGLIVALCILSMGFFSGFLGIGYAFNVIFVGIGLGLIFLLPASIMFFRRNIFSEEYSLENDEDIGFEPRLYWLMGAFCGFFTIMPSFRILQMYYLYHQPELYVCLFTIIFSFIWIDLVLAPHIWNKILPFDIKSNKGAELYLILMALISFIIFIIMVIFC